MSYKMLLWSLAAIIALGAAVSLISRGVSLASRYQARSAPALSSATAGGAGPETAPQPAGPTIGPANPPPAKAPASTAQQDQERWGRIWTMVFLAFVSLGIAVVGFLVIRKERKEQRKRPAGVAHYRGVPYTPRVATTKLPATPPGDPDKKMFADVAGCDEAKAELQEVVDYLKDPSLFKKFGARAPRGVLLVGPPGNGKTLLAKAVAGESGAAFFPASASEFVEMYVGVGASRIRDLFKNAREKKPAIIFIDEIDAVGHKRAGGPHSGSQEWDQTLNQLLVEMDGFPSDSEVIVIAATNRVDILDPALTRPGRFDRQVLVDLPDLAGREAIFKVHTQGKPLAPEINLRLLAERTPGFSGAEIEGACNEAATIAARKYRQVVEEKLQQLKATAGAKSGKALDIASIPQLGALHITLADFDEGIDRVRLGVARTSRAKTISPEEMKNTAYHEVGHAWISAEVEGGDPVSKITIIPRSRALGYTQSAPEGDRYSYTDKQLLARIMMAMGGRVAQEVFLNTVDTGASNDFAQGTQIARRMVTEWGMSKLGHISVGEGGGYQSGYGPALADKIDAAWMEIVENCYKRTREIIERDRERIDKIVQVLLKKETLLRPEWEALRAEMAPRPAALAATKAAGPQASSGPAQAGLPNSERPGAAACPDTEAGSKADEKPPAKA